MDTKASEKIDVEQTTPDVTKTSPFKSSTRKQNPNEIISSLHKRIQSLEVEVNNLRQEKEKAMWGNEDLVNTLQIERKYLNKNNVIGRLAQARST